MFHFSRTLAAAALAAITLGSAAKAETVLRYGISTADIPLMSGQPDRGAGAYSSAATRSMTRWSPGK